MLAVWRPILLNRDIEAERGDLEQVATINIGREERRCVWVSVGATKETDLLAVGRNIRIKTALANALPITAAEIHAPKGVVVGGGIETMEYDPCPVRCERGIVLTNTRSAEITDLNATLRALEQSGFYGSIEIKLEDGKIVLIRKTENYKPPMGRPGNDRNNKH